jgi:hypothetical protein
MREGVMREGVMRDDVMGDDVMGEGKLSPGHASRITFYAIRNTQYEIRRFREAPY